MAPYCSRAQFDSRSQHFRTHGQTQAPTLAQQLLIIYGSSADMLLPICLEWRESWVILT